VRNLNNTIKKIGIVAAAAAMSVLAFAMPVLAAGVTVVTPTNTQGWTSVAPGADTRTGGAVNFVADSSAPSGSGALQLTTDATTSSKAQYMHAAPADTTLASVTELSYYTKQVGASFAQGDASYQLPVYLNGGTSGFTTLVFEPYQNTDQGAVVTGTWQQWDVSAGQFWSSRTVTCSGGTIQGSAGGPASYTLADINATCPNAIVAGFGVNIGSNNPSYNVETDLVSFNGSAYDFELYNAPTNKDECKDNGYKSLTDSNNQPFKNQGQCVSYFNNQK
jgi:hypothetical protein